MKKQALTSATIQALDSSPDAAHKGTQQYLTPFNWAEALSIPLTYTRPVIADLHCGNGDLAAGAANYTTLHMLGHDIDPSAKIHQHPGFPDIKRSTIHADITTTFQHFLNTQIKFDLLTLNPPFSLRWKLDDLPSLRGKGKEEIKGKHIDSTLATIRMANQLLTPRGEALIICNDNAYKRILKDHPETLKHAWLAVTLPSFFPGVSKSLNVTAIYLGKWHSDKHPSPNPTLTPTDPDDLITMLVDIRDSYRPKHAGVTDLLQRYPDTLRTFTAVKEEYARIRKTKKSTPNISLNADGNIRTQLTSYQKASVSITASEAQALKKLNGAHPYQVVLQKASRVALNKLVSNGVWSVCPKAHKAIRQAISSYSNRRVSLTPLSPTQCLAWIDEEDTILCTADFPPFKAGERYPIDTSTVTFKKVERRPCVVRGRRTTEEIHVEGNDLKITISIPALKKKDTHKTSFMHIPDRSDSKDTHTLEDMEKHFHIPPVPDVAQAYPDQYQANLAKIDTLLRKPYKFKKFQREDICRGACVDGLIFGHVQGLGKSLAAFAFPMLKDAKRTIIVAPGGLIKQLRETAAKFYGIPLPVLRNIDDLKKWKIDQPTKPNAKPQFFITTYEALTRNGGDEWEPDLDKDGHPIIKANDKKRILSYKEWAKKTAIARLTGKKFDPSDCFTSIGKTINGITCLWKPTMASMLALYEGQGAGFDSIVLDEATRLQSTNAKMACGIRKLNPTYRILLTGTPIKNKVDSIFHLLHFAAGGNTSPTAQFPFTADSESKENFANLYLEKDRFVSREEARKRKAIASNSKMPKGKMIKRSARICNIHHLWKLIAPTVLRRLKDNCGEDIVERTIRPIIVKPGSAQLAVYGHHLKYPPTSPKSDPTRSLNGRAAKGYQLNILRQVALCPDDPELKNVINSNHRDLKASWTPWTPKLSATLSLVAKLLSQGEQVIIGSPFCHFSNLVHSFLTEAKVPCLLLDGKTSPEKRGLLVKSFKNKVIPVIIAGTKAMGEGHSFECCSHLITPSLSWAYDENDQIVDRIWRLNSKKPVTIYPIVTEYSIDEAMTESYIDKKDSAGLALDARVLTEQVDDIDPDMLLADAYDKFRASADSIQEATLEDGWPQLRKSLTISSRLYKEFHPPITKYQVTPEEIINARNAINATTPEQDFAIAQARIKAKLLLKIKRDQKRKRN